MKMKSRQLFAVLMALVLLFFTYHSPLPIYGSGLSQAATEAVAADVPIDLLPVAPEETVINAITPNPETTQRHSVALKILVNSSVINTATIRVTFGSSLTFHSFRHGSITPQRAHNMVQQSGQYITLTILNTDNFVAGTHLVTLYFDSSTGVTNPVSLLSQQVTAITTDNGSTLSTPFTYVAAMLGDVTGDSAVNSDDQLSILRYVTGKESYNAVQLLAGDVDFNGLSEASDALSVGQYVR